MSPQARSPRTRHRQHNGPGTSGSAPKRYIRPRCDRPYHPGRSHRYVLRVGLEDIYEFRLVADTGQPPISTDEWLLLQRLIVHMQPARSAALEGDPPRSILVHGYGGIEVATGLLRSLERFA